jgi:hypothetical protein
VENKSADQQGGEDRGEAGVEDDVERSERRPAVWSRRLVRCAEPWVWLAVGRRVVAA